MKLWATTNSADNLCVFWNDVDKPVNRPTYTMRRFWRGDVRFCFMSKASFRGLYGVTLRSDRPMRVTLTGRVTK